jgi:hypothetical protein
LQHKNFQLKLNLLLLEISKHNIKNYETIKLSELVDGILEEPLRIPPSSELPLSLNRSYLPANFIKDNLVFRVFFKGNVVCDAI